MNIQEIDETNFNNILNELDTKLHNLKKEGYIVCKLMVDYELYLAFQTCRRNCYEVTCSPEEPYYKGIKVTIEKNLTNIDVSEPYNHYFIVIK